MLHITAQSFQQSEKYHTVNSGASAFQVKVHISFSQNLLNLFTCKIKEEAGITNIAPLTNTTWQVVSLSWPLGYDILHGDKRDND
jgi:hypothetical protein